MNVNVSSQLPERPLSGWQLVAILLCVLVAAIDHSIIATALPIIGRDLHIAQSGLQWIAGSYTVAFAGGLFVAGRLADRYGRKRMLLVGLLVFLLASVYTALVRTGFELSLGRALMGIGGTILLPSTLAIVTTQATKRKALAISLWSGIFGVGVAIGPLLGGTLLNYYDWPSIFWVNVPLLLVALVLVATLVKGVAADNNKPPVHLVDGFISAAALGSLVAAIIEAPDWGLFDGRTLAFIAAGVVFLGTFIYRQLRIPEPLLELGIFRNRLVAIAAIMITLLFMSFSGSLFLLTQYAELVSQFSALKTGLLFIPLSGGLVLGSLWTSAIQSHRSTKSILMVSSIIGAIGTGLLIMQLSPDRSPWVISAYMSIATFGLGAAFAAATATITGALPKRQAGITSALNDITRELGGALGVAIIGSIASWQYGRQIASSLSQYAGTPIYAAAKAGLTVVRAASAGILPNEVINQSVRAFVSGTRLAMVISAVMMVVLAALVGFHMPSLLARKADGASERKRWFIH